tara:strand:- start:98 stop:517 length:420 start_codon:yes stop_codon:yes gene_type:complete
VLISKGIKNELNDLRDTFSIFDNSKDKFIQLMDMAKDKKLFEEEDKIESNRIYGCSSQAWLKTKKNDNNTYSFQTDSDALIVKGLLMILEKIFNNQTAKDILSVDSEYILKSVGLQGSITSQRNNGFSSAVDKIHSLLK